MLSIYFCCIGQIPDHFGSPFRTWGTIVFSVDWEEPEIDFDGDVPVHLAGLEPETRKALGSVDCMQKGTLFRNGN